MGNIAFVYLSTIFIMKHIIAALLLTAISFSNLLAQKNCTLRKDKDGIKVYTCNTDTSKFKSIRAEFTLNASLVELEKFIRNVDNYTTWQYNTVEVKTVKKTNDNDFIYYSKIDVPWPATDRDLVVHFEMISKGEKHFFNSTIVSGLVPEKENTVRIKVSQGQWVITEKNKNQLDIKYSLQVDPAGAVPIWLVNMVCANAPYQSFKKLKEELEKK